MMMMVHCGDSGSKQPNGEEEEFAMTNAPRCHVTKRLQTRVGSVRRPDLTGQPAFNRTRVDQRPRFKVLTSPSDTQNEPAWNLHGSRFVPHVLFCSLSAGAARDETASFVCFRVTDWFSTTEWSGSLTEMRLPARCVCLKTYQSGQSVVRRHFSPTKIVYRVDASLRACAVSDLLSIRVSYNYLWL